MDFRRLVFGGRLLHNGPGVLDWPGNDRNEGTGEREMCCSIPESGFLECLGSLTACPPPRKGYLTAGACGRHAFEPGNSVTGTPTYPFIGKDPRKPWYGRVPFSEAVGGFVCGQWDSNP